MITFPVKTNKENAAVSPLFGKAKYFAFYDGENLTIEENTLKHGAPLIDWFLNKGVKDIIIKEMGINPYKKIEATSMNVYYAGDNRITISELISKYNNKELELLDNKKMEVIIKKHEKSHLHNH
ncbi:NifB/NifX family molybdenum-iron cluster-binding protein [Halarcobacter bivalviorum]|uniref:NifB/NifX family molybdenum-iron cluster-binding protein n=1 Tax=Halarcobacter bivalviorum TaxID=663364 RepID=UPI0013E97C1A|nr:NifB/NifX family molybdenum-iron cluster-binding protein [Halarcobacter bivalviorum]